MININYIDNVIVHVKEYKREEIENQIKNNVPVYRDYMKPDAITWAIKLGFLYSENPYILTKKGELRYREIDEKRNKLLLYIASFILSIFF